MLIRIYRSSKMKPLLLFLFLTTSSRCLAEQAVTFEKIVRYQEIVAGHSIKLVMHQRPYDFSKHEITGGRDGEGPSKIDGVKIGGTDGTSPKEREGWPMLKAVVSIELEWDGQRVSVPPNLHLNLLSLVLEKRSLQFVPRPSGEELLILLRGGDGGGAYGVALVLRKSGNHQQYLSSHSAEEIPAPPYEIVDYGIDKDGRDTVKTFNWLDSDSKGGNKPQLESK